MLFLIWAISQFVFAACLFGAIGYGIYFLGTYNVKKLEKQFLKENGNILDA